MKLLSTRTLCALGLALAGLAFATSAANQDPGTSRALGALQTPIKSLQDEIEEGLVGCWQLSLFESGDPRVAPDSVRCFATFQDGFSTIWWRGDVTSNNFLGGPQISSLVQAEVRHYHVTEFLNLQTAPMYALDNFEGGLRLGGPMEPAEYGIELSGDDLTLSKVGGTRMTFRRVASDVFPQRAVERLNSTRGGRIPMPKPPIQRR